MRKLIEDLARWPQWLAILFAFGVTLGTFFVNAMIDLHMMIDFPYMLAVIVLAWGGARWWAMGFTLGSAVCLMTSAVAVHGASITDPVLLWHVGMFALTTSVVGHVALASRRLHDERERQVVTDPLTGVSNRRGVMHRIREERNRSLRNRKGLTLAYFDLDGFKQVNDVHGHDSGDRLLRAVAQATATSLRTTDAVGRVGGDEFVVILAETNMEQARVAIDKLRAGVQNALGTEWPGVTLSIGVATFESRFPTVRGMLGVADAEMLKVKASGKNAVGYVDFTSC